MTEYLSLLIRQYYEQPKARAEVELRGRLWKRVTDLYGSIPVAFDIDMAGTDQLDIIGRIVDLPRTVNEGQIRTLFGFAENADARGFADKFNTLRPSAPFYDKFTAAFTEYQLNNNQYRKFLKAKIALNLCTGALASDGMKLSAQDAILEAFGGRAYIVDNQSMSVTLYASPTIPPSELRLIMAMGLLPRVDGVTYKVIIQAEPSLTFGFKNNPNSRGFADKFNPSRLGGIFARKLL